MLPPPEPTGSLSGLDMAEQLLAHGADVNARMTKEMTDGLENRLTGISILPAPDGPFIHPRSAEPTRLFSSHHRPGSEAVTQPALTCRGLEARASKGFLRHRSSLVSSPCQAGVLARAARQPAGTGSAKIRWSIAPNRRRVR